MYFGDYVKNYAHNLIPFTNFKVLQRNIKFLIKNHVKGLFEEATCWDGGGGSMTERRSYVMAQLMWKPDCNMDVLVDDFMAGVFKSAAPAVRRERLGMRYIEIYLENPQDPELAACVDSFVVDVKSYGIHCRNSQYGTQS